MKPIVGVMPLWDAEKNSLWMLPRYLDGISMAGGISFVFPFIATDSETEDLKRLSALCDGFLFTGGPDISPALYGEDVLNDTVFSVEKRDRMEQIVFAEAMAAKKPVLGICRGIQFINVMLGGSLYQDIPTQHPSDAEHRQSPPFDAPSHKVEIVKGSPLWECLYRSGDAPEDRLLAVNSIHHQAVKEIAPKLETMAISEDGLIEAVHMPDYPFLWAVQWHPEYIVWTDENSRKIFRAFVDAMQ